MNRTIKLEFLTPLFSHGAMNVPEIRPASIRGMLHEWFRLMGGDIVAERRVFGGVAGCKGHEAVSASSIVVRVADVKGTVVDVPTLPHKSGGKAAPRKAFSAGTTCRIVLSDRLGGLSGEDEKRFEAAVNAWLLVGTLGYRATRAAGSFSWQDATFEMPTDRIEYQDACRNLLDDSNAFENVKVAVLGKGYKEAEAARKAVSDSLGGPERNGQDDLGRLHNPLGGISPRKTSPLKYRIVQLKTGFHILALWDNRQKVTGNMEDDFYGVIDLLAEKKPELGRQLREAFG